MSDELSILRLVGNATLIVQLVMALLLLASVYSWSIILQKLRLLGRTQREANEFEQEFWASSDLSALFRATEAQVDGGMPGLFVAGFREFARMSRQSGAAADSLLDGARRAMKAAQLKETERLEHNLATLATIGSTSPYVGLFGTVWGIMHAFISLGSVQQATLALVAPGIAEALIATAMGLVAAIPAVVAYNRFADQVSRLELRCDAFVEEFTTLLQRSAARNTGG